ncbi:hypothetical protein CDD82_1979 [Ophiocordyceps australis]|uniref:Uncharacterized protein n=1 Tax=Ophiocordyceps australis TaxID=1399860 RepID=A0A2C5ZLC0_9HYPO|nr:hypothetical protein CDD82_1979 [Ophiocordyceps australis]
MVTESQKKAGVSPEASGVPAEVLEKSEVEDELTSKLKKAPVTSEGDSGSGAGKGKTAAAVGGVGGAAAGAGSLAGQDSLQSSTVPQVVKDSQNKAGVSPEASGLPQEVKEKSEVEDELTRRVKQEPATSQGTSGFGTEKSEKTGLIAGAAAAGGGAVVAAAIAAKDAFTDKAGPAMSDMGTAVADTANRNLPDSVKKSLPESAQGMLAGETKNDPRNKVSPEVPGEVKKSIAESGQNPEAAASTAAVEEKKQVESELLKEVKPAPAAVGTKPPTSGAAAGGAPVGAGPGTPAGAPTGVAKVAPTETATVTPIGSAVSPSSGAAASAPIGSTSGDAATDKIYSGTSAGPAAGDAPIGSSTGAAPGASSVDAARPTTGATAQDSTRAPTGTGAGIPLVTGAGAATGGAAGAAALGSTADSQAIDSSVFSEPSPFDTTGQGMMTDAAKPEASKATPKAEKAKDDAALGGESKSDEAKAKDDKASKRKSSKASKGSKKGEAGRPETAPALGGTNGSDPAAAESSSKPADTPTSAEKKKKHRLSSIFSKIKDKLSDKK